MFNYSHGRILSIDLVEFERTQFKFILSIDSLVSLPWGFLKLEDGLNGLLNF